MPLESLTDLAVTYTFKAKDAEGFRVLQDWVAHVMEVSSGVYVRTDRASEREITLTGTQTVQVELPT